MWWEEEEETDSSPHTRMPGLNEGGGGGGGKEAKKGEERSSVARLPTLKLMPPSQALRERDQRLINHATFNCIFRKTRLYQWRPVWQRAMCRLATLWGGGGRGRVDHKLRLHGGSTWRKVFWKLLPGCQSATTRFQKVFFLGREGVGKMWVFFFFLSTCVPPCVHSAR